MSRPVLRQIRNLIQAQSEARPSVALGSLEAFNSNHMDWTVYEERLENYFEANRINSEDEQRALFLTVVGEPIYKLLRDLIAPQKPKELLLQDLLSVLRAHLSPEPLIIAERYHFYNRAQREGETVGQYMAALRNLASKCDFKTFLEEALRDRFVFGLRDDSTKQKLMGTKNLVLENAMNANERARHELDELKKVTDQYRSGNIIGCRNI